MKRFALIFIMLLQAAFGQQQWSIGYWTPWGNPACPISAIQFDGLTHIVQWGALVRPDGTIDVTTNNFTANAPTLIAAAHGANVKVILGLTQPYWQGGTTNFQQAVTNNRTAFVNNIMNLVNTYGFDGVDIDWEPFNGGTNGAAMSSLITSLRAQLGSRLLTTAAIVTDYAYWGSVAGSLDRVNVMTYDMSGTWDPYSWHNASLYADNDMVWSIDLAVRRYTAAGVPTSKLGIGIPFYGWQWTGGGVSGPRQTFSGPNLSQTSYHEFYPQITAQNKMRDSRGAVPYLTNNAGSPSFLSFDDEQSVAEKVNYAKSKGLGGWIIWALDQDYFPSASVKHPLMTAIRNAMGTAQTAPTITSTSLPAAISGTAYSQSLTATGSSPISWTISGGSLPAGLSLSSSTGVISGTPSGVGVFSLTATATNPVGSNSKSFNLTVNAPVIAPSITTASPLPAAVTGTAYSQTLAATGTSPINWSITSGSLPSGLTLATATGVVSGTPNAAGTFSFTVQASNAAGSNTRQYSLTASNATSAPVITTASLPSAAVGAAFSVALTATGTSPINWSIVSGALPSGLTLNASTGVISGTPSASGSFSFTVKATNAAGSAQKPLSLTVSPAAGANPTTWSMGYWTNWGNPPVPVSDIDWSALTHVTQFAALVNADGTLDLNTYGVAANAPSLVAAAHASGVKALLSISQPMGQGTSGNFYVAAADYRSTLVAQILSVVNQYGFDGVDIYWQPFSAGANSSALSSFSADLRTALGSRIMTTAAIVTDSAYWGTVHSYYDRINLRTYDLTGTWNPYSWHNAALHDNDGQVWSVNLAVQRFTQNGVPAAKLGIGLPFFGYQWTGGGISAPRQNWSAAPTLQAIPYNSFASQATGGSAQWDSAAQAAYLSNNAGTPSFLTFDNAQSIGAKINFVKTNGLGGWFIWSLDGDYLPSANPKHPLLAAVKLGMGNSGSAPAISTTSQLPDATAGVAYSFNLASSGTAPITWKVSAGTLPAGLSLSSSTGSINGTPSTAGTSTFTVTATNAYGSNSKQVTLTVTPSVAPPSITLLTPSSRSRVTNPVWATVKVSPSVVSVTYRINGTAIATVTDAPFWSNLTINSTDWVTLDAVAKDASGKTATSQKLTIRLK